MRHRSRDAGTITFSYVIGKQDGAAAVDGESVILVAARPA